MYFLGLEMTIKNIKKACTIHFRHSIGAGTVCDILAGDQGLSCRTMKQIPNLKLIHVRFIPETEIEVLESLEDTKTSIVTSINSNYENREGSPDNGSCAKRNKSTRSLHSPSKAMRMSVPAPRSLSVATILQLGKLVKANTTLVNLYSFNIQSLTWSTMPLPVAFKIGHDVLGEGGGGSTRPIKPLLPQNNLQGKPGPSSVNKAEALEIIGKSIKQWKIKFKKFGI